MFSTELLEPIQIIFTGANGERALIMRYISRNKIINLHKFNKEVQTSKRFSAYFLVNSSAFFINFFLSFVYSSANSVRSECSGSGGLNGYSAGKSI
ncbi:hypothetical protein T4A_475 [Trichinella pseudospiralis]|uniref:Uncharacterized protein n=1 Tax=Trichinella pseudospiralis TaxID=6337 RepID=A0A0V1EU55_TRIPS|nr:hypothetical protein T4A_475 [Trichinella pseudospiralis]